MSEELRDAVAKGLYEQFKFPPIGTTRWDRAQLVADALLSGPLAPLLAAQAAVERVEALCDVADDQPDGYECEFIATHVLRDALNGPT